jgi:hypothetical protein
MNNFLADYYGTPFIGGKKEATGFDVGEDRTPAGKRDVEKAAREYAVSRPCRTRKATPEELAELDRILGKKGNAK